MVDKVIQSLKVSVLYCIFCYVVQSIFTSLLKLVPESVASQGIKFQTANRGMSTIHAIVMFSLTANYWINKNPNFEVTKGGSYEDFCIDLMLGYLYYDVVQELRATAQLDTLGHHVMGMASHWSTRFFDCNAAYFYTMVVYIAEGSTPFLHTCWTLHTFKLGSHPAFLPLCGMLILTFFAFRIIQGGYILYHLATYRDIWGEHFFSQVMNTIILVLFVLLNCYWFAKLVQMATGLGKKSKKEK